MEISHINLLRKGEIQNSNIFEVNLTLYRDCSQFNVFDSQISIGVYKFDGQTYTFIRSLIAHRGDFKTINPTNPTNNKCTSLPNSLCTEQTNYISTIELPEISESYIIYHQRCCRNVTIDNIISPFNTGITFFCEITSDAQIQSNSSPVLNNLPPIFICAGRSFAFPLSAADKDGDSLIYEFCSPLAGGGSVGLGGTIGNPNSCDGIKPNPSLCPPPFKKIEFISNGYSFDQPFGVGNATINSFTGVLSGKVDNKGQFQVGVCIYEFKKGKLIGITRREF